MYENITVPAPAGRLPAAVTVTPATQRKRVHTSQSAMPQFKKQKPRKGDATPYTKVKIGMS